VEILLLLLLLLLEEEELVDFGCEKREALLLLVELDLTLKEVAHGLTHLRREEQRRVRQTETGRLREGMCTSWTRYLMVAVVEMASD
jgi:hypothetical protein